MLTQPLRGLLKRQNNQCAGGGPCFDGDDSSYYDSQDTGFYNDVRTAITPVLIGT